MISDRDRAALAPMSEAVESARRLDFASAAGLAVKSVVQFYALPENQAFLTGAFIGAAATARLRFWPGVLVSYCCGLAAQKAYLMAAEVRDGVRAIAEAAKPDGADVPAAG